MHDCYVHVRTFACRASNRVRHQSRPFRSRRHEPEDRTAPVGRDARLALQGLCGSRVAPGPRTPAGKRHDIRHRCRREPRRATLCGERSRAMWVSLVILLIVVIGITVVATAVLALGTLFAHIFPVTAFEASVVVM